MTTTKTVAASRAVGNGGQVTQRHIQNNTTADPLATVSSDPSAMTAAEFFRALWGDGLLPGFLTIWTLPDKVTQYIRYITFTGRKAQEAAADHDVYFGLGLRGENLGDKKRGESKDVVAIPGIWAEIDIRGENHKETNLPETREEALGLAYSMPWAPSMIVFSGGGLHVYWLFPQPWTFTSDEERERAQDLLRRFQAGLMKEGTKRGWKIDNTSDLARVLRVPGTWNRKHAPVKVEVLEYFPDRRFTPEDFEGIRGDVPTSRDKQPASRTATTGKVVATSPDVIERARRYVAKEPPAISGQGGHKQTFHVACVLVIDFDLSPAEALPLLEEYNSRLEEKWTTKELIHKLEDADKRTDPRGRLRNAPLPADDDHEHDHKHLDPDLLPEIHDNAYHGLAGRIVNAIDPYTESSRAATLVHTLVGFGNMVGAGPHAVVGVERHPPRLNICLVGPTSSGRKGSAWRPCKEIFRRCDEFWVADRVRSGLSSGEGIVYHLRDPEGKDAGVTDKRLLAIEAEFSSMLKIMGREGNSLSGVLRTAWDDGNLATLTKNSPLKATGAHFSLIGHTTSEELLRYLDATEKGNGFANRILWLLVKRSKLLPDGEPIPESVLDELAGDMAAAVKWARADRCIRRDPLAAELWRKVYPQLVAEKPGMSGAILSRAEAQALRLSLVYALLDRSLTIRVEHLQAALAVWEACEQSVLAIFGDKTGDPIADRIMEELRNRGEMTRDDVVNLFSRHRTDQADRALEMLERIGRIVRESKPTGGRPVTVYRTARKASKAR